MAFADSSFIRIEGFASFVISLTHFHPCFQPLLFHEIIFILGLGEAMTCTFVIRRMIQLLINEAYSDSYLELSCPEYNYMARLNYLHSIHMNIRFRSSILLFICMSKHQNPMQLHAYIQQLRKRNFWLRATNRKPGLNPTTDCFKIINRMC